MRIKVVAVLTAVVLAGSLPALAQGPQTILPKEQTQKVKYPMITLYSVSWCPHCKAVKEYFAKNNIPYMNKDVELDAKAMEELTGKYHSRGVPLIVLGQDQKVLQGFTPENFQKALEEMRKS